MTLVEQLPEGVKLSPHLRENAKGYIQVSAYGLPLFIAATPPVRRLLGLDKPLNRDWSRQMDADSALRDIVNSLELQVRDNVLAGIQENVTQRLLDELAPRMQEKISERIAEQLPKQLTDGAPPGIKESNK